MTSTRGNVLTKYNGLLRRSSVTHLTDELSQKLLAIARASLEFFDVRTDSGDTELPETEDVKTFVQQSLPPISVLFGDAFFRMESMPMMVMKEVADLYGFGTAEAPFIRAMNLETFEAVSAKYTAIVWFCWMVNQSPEFSRKLLDDYKYMTESPRRGGSAFYPRPNQDGGGNYSARGGQVQGDRSRAPTEGVEPSNDTNIPSPVSRDVNVPVDQDPRHGNSHGYLRGRSGTGHEYEYHQARENNDSFNDRRMVGYVQQAFKENRFNGDLKQSISITLHMYELTARQFGLNDSQMADLFIHTLDGSARLFFINNVKMGDSYGNIRSMMMSEYNSDARQVQVEGHLQQLRLRDLMAEESIIDERKGLTALVNKIEELVPQCHPDFQSDRHKMRYLSDAVAEFSEWSLGPIENINSQKFTFNRFVTALHESMQAKLKVKMLKGEAHRSSGAIPSSTHIGQYSRNPRHLRREQKGLNRSDPGGPPRTFEDARRRNLCFKCHGKWSRGHKCAEGSIRSNMRDRILNGQSAVHLVSCLVDLLECEETNTEEKEDSFPTHLAEDANDALAEFDSYHLAVRNSRTDGE